MDNEIEYVSLPEIMHYTDNNIPEEDDEQFYDNYLFGGTRPTSVRRTANYLIDRYNECMEQKAKLFWTKHVFIDESTAKRIERDVLPILQKLCGIYMQFDTTDYSFIRILPEQNEQSNQAFAASVLTPKLPDPALINFK